MRVTGPVLSCLCLMALFTPSRSLEFDSGSWGSGSGSGAGHDSDVPCPWEDRPGKPCERSPGSSVISTPIFMEHDPTFWLIDDDLSTGRNMDAQPTAVVEDDWDELPEQWPPNGMHKEWILGLLALFVVLSGLLMVIMYCILSQKRLQERLKLQLLLLSCQGKEIKEARFLEAKKCVV